MIVIVAFVHPARGARTEVTAPSLPHRIETEVAIAWPPERIFAYVTTPTLWHTWHAATVEVREAASRPLTTGETMLELIALAGRRFATRWVVTACEAPRP